MLNLDYKDVAEKYGGNKQKIAEAAALGALGPEGPLLALAAGQYIDRMRAAQAQEQAPQQTVAQQVLAPQPQLQMPPMPQGGPAMPPQGLGAIAPQGEAPMPEAPMPEQPMMEEAPMGMAAGGLADLPVPDAMFDEPTNGGFNDGYAGGGLVAFARGGEAELDAFRRAIIAQESGGRYGVPNAQGSGAMGVGQIMPDTARALAKRLGRDYRPDLLAGTSPEAREYQDALTAAATEEAWNYGKGDPKLAAAYYFAGPNKKGWGAKTARYQEDIMRRLGAPLPERDMESAQGRFSSFLDQLGVANEVYGQLPEDIGSKEAIAYWEKQRSPEEQKKERTNDMWASLAQIGASMMGTSSPNFLQAVGQAIGGALPGAEASRKERKAAEREAVTALSELYGMDRKEAKEKMKLALDLHAVERGAEEAQTDRAFRAAQAAEERDWRTTEAEKQRVAALELAGAKEKGFDALVSANYAKLKREADLGVWKTPQGNKPSDEITRYWAYQHAIAQWAQRNPGQQQGSIFGAPGIPAAQGGAPAGNEVDFSQLK